MNPINPWDESEGFNGEREIMSNLLDLDALNSTELGTSLFELIEFTLERKINGKTVRGIYGINVAKVREVVRMPKINPLASRVKGIAGIFELRGIPIPAIHLAKVLGDEDAEIDDNQQIIVAEFSRKRAGFIVNQTNRIRRIAWDKVLPPADDAGTSINGMTLIENNDFLFILDLEKIVYELEAKAGKQKTASTATIQAAMNPVDQMQAPAQPVTQINADPQTIDPGLAIDENAPTILLVDDSALILNSVKSSLLKLGYNVVIASNGAEAYEMLIESAEEDMADDVDVLVTDVEMPRMDGLTLTQKLREHPDYRELPILLHSSLSGNATQEKGANVGANGYVIKNDIQYLNELLKEILGDRIPTPIAV